MTPQNLVNGATAADITGTTATAIIAGITNQVIYVTDIMVTNGHATVQTRVDIIDTSDVPILLWTGFAAAAGGGYAVELKNPIPATKSKGISAICGTNGAQVRVSISGFASG